MRRKNGLTGASRLALTTALMLGVMGNVGGPAEAATAPADRAQAQVPASSELQQLIEEVEHAKTNSDLGAALVQLKNAVRLKPRNGEIRAYLGIALLKSGDTRTAERELRDARKDRAPDEIVVPPLLDAMLVRGEAQELLDEFPDPPAAKPSKVAPDILRQRALALQILGRGAEAKETMERSLSLRRDSRALTAKAKLAAEQGDLTLAQRTIDEAIKLAPMDEDVLVSQVALLYQSGDLDKTLTAADEFVQRLPLSVTAKVLRIEVLLSRKQDALARAELDELLKVSPDLSFGPYYGGVLAGRANNFQDAWHQEQTLKPEFILSRPSIAMMVAEIAIASGNVASGAAILTGLVSRRPDLVSARIRLAEVTLTLQRPDDVARILDPIKTSDDIRVQAMLGQAYSQLGRYNEAVAALDKAIRFNKDGDNDFLKLQRAQSAFELGDSDRAASDLRELETAQPRNWGIGLSLIGSLVQAEKIDDALNVLDRMPKEAARDKVLVAFYRGRLLGVKSNLQGAETAFTEALAFDPKFVPALYFRGHVLVARGNSEAGKKDFQQILALNPGNISAYLALAQIAVHEGQDAEAFTLLDAAIRATPRELAPRLALVTLQINRREFDDAQAALDNALKISPNNPEAMIQVGQIQFLMGDADKAVDTFRGLAAAYTNSAGAYVLLAKALNATKDRLAAIDAARRAVELSPLSTPIRLLLVEYLIAGGRSEQALQSARDFVKTNPGPEADTLLASVLVRLDKTNEANTYLTARLAAKPDRLLVLQLTQIALTKGDSKKAIAMLADWLRKYSGDYDTRRAYGSLLLHTGDVAGARKELETLLKDRPEDPAVLNDLGWSLQTEDPSRAYALVSLAARIAPQSEDVMDTLAWLKFQRRDVQGALSLLERAHKLDAADDEIGYHYAVALDAAGNHTEAKTLLQSIVSKNTNFTDKDNAKKLLARW